MLQANNRCRRLERRSGPAWLDPLVVALQDLKDGPSRRRAMLEEAGTTMVETLERTAAMAPKEECVVGSDGRW